MGFLNPVFLAAAAALAVPLMLHLFHRYRGRTVVFPALRYLLRTEREHARRIRLRQLLLLMLRCLAVLLLVLAGARPFLRGSGEAHPPTALVIVLDNSLSAGRVTGDDRVLDRLKTLALRSADLATVQDRIWVVRAGEPWDLAIPGGPGEARQRIVETEISGSRGDLSATLSRARRLIETSELPSAEIHVLSDLQASAFDTIPVPPVSSADEPGPPPTPTLAFIGVPAPGPNRFVRDVGAGGGLPPLANRRFEAVVELGGTPGDTVAATVRLVLDDEVRGATTLRPGASAVLPAGPFPHGVVTGYAEVDADELRADDRRYLVFPVRPPPVVRVTGDAGPFVEDALAVLEAAGRIVRPGDAGATAPEVLVSGQAEDLDDPAPFRLVIPPTDATLLPALNRRLEEAGLAWRYAAGPVPGDLRAGEAHIPISLDDILVRARYQLASEGAPRADDEVLVALSDGTPFLVEARGTRGDHLLLASPFDEASTTLPVDAAMVPLVEWIVSGWHAGADRSLHTTGDPLPLPSAATQVELPDGTRVPADGSSELRPTRDPGIYTVLRGDSVLERLALNASVRESLLAPLSHDALREHLGEGLRAVDDPRDWQREIFIDRQGRELWRPLVLTAVLLLVLEAWMAASGGRGRPRRLRTPLPATAADAPSAPHA